MGAPGLTSPIRAQGFENFQLNAGVFLENFNMAAVYSAQTLRGAVAQRIAAGDILGMTTGGGTFSLTRETRVPEVDGRRYLHKGAQFVDSMDANITSTLVEIVDENWKTVIGTAELDTEASGTTKNVLKMHTAIDPETDYLTNIVWVGDIADGGLAAIEISNALNTADVTFTFSDKNEGKLPFELHAHQEDVNSYDIAPVRLYFFEEDEAMFVYSGTKTSSDYDTHRAILVDPVLPAGKYTVKFYSDNLHELFTDTNCTLNNIVFEGGNQATITDDDYIDDGMFQFNVSGEINVMQFTGHGSKRVTTGSLAEGNLSVTSVNVAANIANVSIYRSVQV